MARRRSQYSYYDFYSFPASKPREAQGGIKARSKRGAFAKSWWASRWINAMERLMDKNRLQRGRAYARKGQVLSIKEKSRGIEARVQGSQRTPYKVMLEVEPLSNDEWEQVIDALGGQAIFATQLLAGEMPTDIEEVFGSAGVSLFPEQRGDLVTDCSCPDWVNPCKRSAATHFILGERFEEDPFLLFRLRGRTQEQILEAVRQRRVLEEPDQEDEIDAETEEAIPLEETLASFWDTSEALDAFPLSIRQPSVHLPMLKRLGEAPFISGGTLDSLLGPAYELISLTAISTAFDQAAAQEDA